MTPETFCEQFATFAEAPNGIAKLRELILQLAVQGKLVSQDVNHEPASVLADRIEAERVRRIKAGELRDLADDRGVDESILPFALPPTWKWVRLGRIMQKMGAGSTPLGGKKVYVDDGVIFLRSQNVWDDGLVLDDVARIAPEVHQDMSGTWVEPGDVLLNITGASIGRSALVPDEFGDANVSQHVAILRLIDKDVRQFLHLCVISPFFQATIMRVQVGVSREGLSMTRLREFPFPLPPLAEQRRIVGKVDQLLGLCDELAARQAARREARSALVGATLDRLVSPRRQPNSSSPSPQSSGERGAGGEGLNRSKRRPPHPQPFSPEYGGEGSKDMDINRLRDHFDRLFDTPTTLPQLRQAILQLAVQGQLVPQDPDDEPARVADDATNVCGLFDIPSQWQWVTVEQIGYSRLGKMLDKVKNKGTPFAYLRNTNVHWFRFDLSSIKEMPFAHDELDAFEVHPGDVLICEGGHGIGRTAVWNGELKRVMFQKALHRVRPSRNLDGTFFAYCMRVYDSTGVLQTYYTGAGIPHLTGRSLAKVAFPLPPLSEQKRIVLKVTELLSLCDALEAKLTQAESASSQLLSASVHHLLKRL